MGISISYNEEETQESHGSQAIEEKGDFSSKKELKKSIKSRFKSFTCPNCNGHRITGDGVVIDFGKVKFFKEEHKKGIFGSKYVSKNTGNVYRIYSIYLESGGFFSSAGYIRCKSCQWEVKGNKKNKTRWVSINDVLRGNI